MDLKDIYKPFHSKAAKYPLFSSAHETFSKTDQTLGHKPSHNKLKKTQAISSHIFSHHSGMQLEINYKKITVKIKNIWRLNNMLTNGPLKKSKRKK